MSEGFVTSAQVLFSSVWLDNKQNLKNGLLHRTRLSFRMR